MKKVIVILIALIMGMKLLYAQNSVVPGSTGYYDFARLFSQTYTAGTARMQAIGGAQISLGGDLSMAHTNPAGLGSFNRSSFSLTPSLDFHSSSTSFEGNTLDDFGANFNVGQLGFGLHHDGSGDYRGGTFAITMTRTNNFHNSIGFTGTQREGSILDTYIGQAEGIIPDNLFGELEFALEQALIEEDTLSDINAPTYISYIEGNPRQVGQLVTSGRQHQWDFAYGGNYADKIFFGFGIGISSLNYREEYNYLEDNFQFEDGARDFAINSIERNTVYEAEGVGANATVGMIFRPVSFLRLGWSIKTPTYYNITDSETFDLISTDDENLYADGYVSTFEYTLRTPWRYSLGASVFLGKHGFISTDVELVDYSNAKINTNSIDIPMTEDNLTINNLYKTAINYRIGGEYRFGVMRFRAGYGLVGNAASDEAFGSAIHRISGGVGYREQDMFIDLSVVHSSFDSNWGSYAGGSVAESENENVNVSLTLGFNF